MNRSLGLVLVVACLLRASLGQRSDLLISFGTDDKINEVALGCQASYNKSLQSATFTFTSPTGFFERTERTESSRQSFTFTIGPQNEPVVSCRVDGDSEDSERVAITALPQAQYNTNVTAISQYVFSDSDTIELICSLDTGRLHGLITPYEFFWNLKVEGGGQDEVSNADVNNTVGTFHYRDNNRLLNVNLSSLRPDVQYSFQCLGRVQRCNSTNLDNQDACGVQITATSDSPFIAFNFVDPVVITNPPSNVNVTQGQDAPFNCTVTNGEGDITIKWEINGTVYDSGNCSDICTVDETDNSSILTIYTGNMDRVTDIATFKIVCIVNQTVFEQSEGLREMVEVRSAYRGLRSEAAQLIVSPDSTSQPQDIYIIIVCVICGSVILIIIMTSFCIFCIFRYHYKNKESMLGRKLRRTFSRDPQAMLQRYTKRDTSQMELELQHFQGTESAPTNYADTNTVQVVNGNHLLGPHAGAIYNQSQQSGVSGLSSYSGLSGISQNNGPHHMPHYREPSITYQEGVAVQSLGLPPASVDGNGALLFANHHSSSGPHQMSHIYEPSNHSSKSSGYHSVVSSLNMNEITQNTYPHTHYISRKDLATVELALMHNKNCQIPGCYCYKVRKVIESRVDHRLQYDLPQKSSIYSKELSNSISSRLHRVGHQQSSTDSDSDYYSERDRRSRPANLRLLSEEHHRHPNLHPHYHLTTKSHLRRVNMQAPVDHRRPKSLSDLTPLTDVPETQTPAVGGIIKPDTPAYDCPPALGENNTEQRDEWNCPKGHPALLREISISADNIPALCLNDCPFTPSPHKEGGHPLAQSPNKPRHKGISIQKASLISVTSNLETIKERTSIIEIDDTSTSSHADLPIKSDDDVILTDIQKHPNSNNDDRHNYPTLHEPATKQMVEDSDRNTHIHQSTYFSEAETKAEVPFLDHQVLECDCNGKEYTNTEHDITLRIPEGAVAAGERVHLEVGVAMFGPFNFPTNTQPISPILWLCLLEENVKLRKPFQIILPHYLVGLNEERLMHHQICFAKASHSSFTFEDQQVCYEFNSHNSAPLLFASSGRKSYGIVTINHFCFYCLLAKQTPELARDAGYCLVRIESFLTPQRNEVIFSAIYFLDTCLKSLEEQFSREKITRCNDFKFKELQDDAEPYIKVVIQSDHEGCVLGMEPAAAKIRISDIDFWKKRFDDIKRRHERKMYPPRVKMTVCANTRNSDFTLKLPVKFEGCTDDSQLDTELTISFGNSGLPSLSSFSLSSSLSSRSQGTSQSILSYTPKLKDTFKELLSVAAQWKTIGVLLGIEKHVLDRIESDKQRVNDCLLEMLSEWLKQVDPPPTWNDIADAVEMDDPLKAKEIRKRSIDIVSFH